MFRSSTIIRKFTLNLAKVIFALKISVKLSRYLLCVVWQHVMEWRVCCMQKHATHTPFHDMLPHNRLINTDVISQNVLI
jgi:hypothetical protein